MPCVFVKSRTPDAECLKKCLQAGLLPAALEGGTMMREMIHPDLALLLQPEHQSICCMVIPDCACDFEPLHPFHRYEEDGMTALLFERVGDIAAFIRDAEKLLEQSGGVAGLSGPFALSVSARGCLNKARIALETGKKHAPGKRLYTMGELGEAALIDACAAAMDEMGFCAEDFCDDVLSHLEQADQQEQMQYVQSLHGYLENGLNLRQAASLQGIHRNTLAYRIRRIQERFSLDLENKNTCFELWFSFWLREHFPKRAALPQAIGTCAQMERLLWRYVHRSKEQEAPFAMCACYVDTSRLDDSERDALILRLSRVCDACAFHEEEIYLACAPEEIGELSQKVSAACEGLDCSQVVAGEFGSQRLWQKIALCRWAAHISAQNVTYLRDVGSTLFFAAVSRRTSLLPYLSEEVIRVMDEDAIKGSSLSHSLFAFLLNFNDIKEAAGQTGMHRNTMEYQIRKIESFIGGPLDEKRRFMMMCTYRILALPDMEVC